MRVVLGNAQHQGSRKEQQDDFGFSDTEDLAFTSHGGVLAVVTDGMGGLAQGREASLLAKRTMLQEYEEKSNDETIPQVLRTALAAANASVIEMAQGANLEGQIGTTLAAAVIKDDELYWISVGDSHIYLCRQGGMFQLNTDHDYARHLALEVEKGTISPEEAANHPQRQALTSYVGHPNLSEVDQNEAAITLKPGDRILLCSDGLYKTLSEEEIIRLVDQQPQHAAEELIGSALAKGKTNQDNVTVAILACEPETETLLSTQPHKEPLPLQSRNNLNSRLIIIFILFVSLLGAAYLAKYFIYPRIHAKANITATPKAPPVLPGPPLAEDKKEPLSPTAADSITQSSEKKPEKSPSVVKTNKQGEKQRAKKARSKP